MAEDDTDDPIVSLRVAVARLQERDDATRRDIAEIKTTAGDIKASVDQLVAASHRREGAQRAWRTASSVVSGVVGAVASIAGMKLSGL